MIREFTIKLLAAVLLIPAAGAGSTYYVDCAAGDDAAAGTSPATAWRSLRAVSAREFHAGEMLRLRRGTKCSGTLSPKGSGEPNAPIVLDAWGDGPLPQIQAEAGAEAALRLSDQEYWTIQHLKFIGGDPHGIFITGTKGVLHGIHIRNVIVHGVTGTPKNKEGGLLVIAHGSAQQRFDDVLVDGVTAYGTSQWAGILVGGVAFGFLPEEARSTNVAVRNSIVHDVAGDGIVLFQVNRGIIENSAAWYTGMQDTQTIGTPSAIWTWMCRDCAVRRCEAFLIDSPGVDGGAFDIDYGNDHNVVEESYGHDTQGYCVSIFGAGWTTTQSTVRRNVCAANGRSPRLAARQGAVYLSTWDKGRLQGVEIYENRIWWNPPIATEAVVNTADFEGTGAFDNNAIQSSVPRIYRGNESLRLGRVMVPTQPVAGRDGGPMPVLALREPNGQPVALGASPGAWRLYAFVSSDGNGLTIAASAHRQFHSLGLDTVLIVPADLSPEQASNLRWDWNLPGATVLCDDGAARKALQISGPAIILVSAAGRIAWRHDGLTSPGDLGLILRSYLGNPDYAQLISER